MTTTVGAEAAEDLAEHWLDTGGIPVLKHDGTRSYPKRSDVRRAEARRTSRTHPAGSRRPSQQRPPAPVAALRSPEAAHRPTLQTRYPQAMLPTPAVLPIPQTSPERPAGIALPVSLPTSPDAFHRSQPAPVPLAVGPEWGLDLTEEPEVAEQEPARRRSGRMQSAATRLLVMALVVGAEGVALAQFAGPIEPERDSNPAVATLKDVLEQEESHRRAEAEQKAWVQAEEERAQTTVRNLKDSSPAKAEAAQAQSERAAAALKKLQKRKADAARQKKERAADLARAKAEAKARADAKAKDDASAIAEAKAETKSESKPKTKPPAAKPEKKTSSRKKALQNARKNPQAAAKVLLKDRGWSNAQYTCLDSLWTRESNWNYQATNPTSGAYGIPQALPGSKMGASGGDWKTNPVTQIRWGLDYISERYGNPCGAWEHSERRGWY